MTEVLFGMKSPTGGTGGAGITGSIFIKDKILDGDGEVWEYDGSVLG